MTLRARLVRGLAGGLLYEVIAVVFSMVSMVVLVRLLAPGDYGRAAATAGILGLIGAFRGAMFAEQALQHAGESEPDWDACFAITGLVQAGLAAVTVAVAVGIRVIETLAPLSPLLMVGALGFLVDWPAQMATVRLRRDLRVEALKLLMIASLLLKMASAILLAWIGWGAMALVMSSNVLSAIPLAAGLLIAQGWRPSRSSLVLPPASRRDPILRFGAQQIMIGLVGSLRSAADAVVLTHVVGAAGFGLVNRAQALYQTTVGRFGLLFVEIFYPILPRAGGEPHRYAVRASRFVEGALILTIPGAVFVALEGKTLSRLLYGPRWTDADPLLVPAALGLAAAALVSVSTRVLMGAGRMQSAVRIEMAAAGAAMVSLMAAWATSEPARYLWVLATVQALCAVVSLVKASPCVAPDWRRSGLAPALAASCCGAAGVWAVRSSVPGDQAVTSVLSALVFVVLVAAMLALTAHPLMRELRELRRSSVDARLSATVASPPARVECE